MGTLTVGQIVDYALDQGGLDTSFRTKCRGWLNFVVNKLAENNNYKFYNVVAPDVAFIAGQTTYPLPADFQSTDTIYRVQNQNGTLVTGNQIFVLDSYVFDQYTKGLNGDPTLAMVDTESNNIIFNNVPGAQTQTSYRLRYFRKPANYAVDGSQDNLIPDFPSDDVLNEELLKIIFKREDDERYQLQSADAKAAQIELQRNQFQNIDSQVVQLAHPNFVRRWRR